MPRILGARVAHLPVLDGARSWRGRMVDFVLRRLVLARLLRYRHCRSAGLVMWNRSSWGCLVYFGSVGWCSYLVCDGSGTPVFSWVALDRLVSWSLSSAPSWSDELHVSCAVVT